MARISNLKRMYAVCCREAKDTSIVVYKLGIHIAVAVSVQTENLDVRDRTRTRLERLILSLSDNCECEVARTNIAIAEAINVCRLGSPKTFLF